MLKTARLVEDNPGKWSGPMTSPAIRATDSESPMSAATHDRAAGKATAQAAATRIRQLEDLLRQSQKMEAVGQLAGGVAHDFNNLLTVIGCYTELIASAIGPDAPMRAELDEISKAADSASSLTRTLLAFSRKHVPQLVRLDLNSVATGLEPMFRRLIGGSIEMSTIVATEHATVLADASQIEQVLLNLVLNARKAMPLGGRLAIEIANVALDEGFALVRNGLCAAGPNVLLSVSDTGAGIPPDVRNRIFEPFGTTTEQGPGTGLGLATVYEVVKQLRGHIWVEGEPGAGATFRFCFPRIAAPDVENAATSGTRDNTAGSETILLVEDEEALRTLGRRILLSHGYTVLVARHGRDALLIARDNAGRIDLVVTDLVMPEFGGIELADAFRKMEPDIPVIFMSGYSDRELGHGRTGEHGVDFLHKPFTGSGLVRTVRAALDKAAARTHAAGGIP